MSSRAGTGKSHFKKKNEKFKLPFKKKVANWKTIDAEIKELLPRYEKINLANVKTFEDLPLSKRTLQGLEQSNYSEPTDIQRETISLALRGYDVLGAAKTGSGKTLAFLIPVLECLYHAKWTKFDGLGVLIISPTRELAYQTFEVLKKMGTFHDFSAGLVIGGKDLKTESKIISQTNIIICTPGRLLQHMDETWNFNCDNLKILVLDEADRMLDMGFAQAMNSIVANLPTTRQTLLFSATQTKSIKDLARLSLKNPAFVSVHEHANNSTPENLEQSYVVCEAHDKISFLWSFIRSHLNQKILVFFQSCKQVKYVYELFTKMQTGMLTLSLYGTMNQIRRMQVYDQFCRKSNAVLFATDIAARGLDFPSINWVVQMDCPPDVNTYIHRVGRTARYESNGQAIIILSPSEQPEMLKELQAKKIPITHKEVNMKRIINIDAKIQSLCAGDVELKESAKRALMAYMRSLFLMSNKKIFKIDSIDIDQFASSHGLIAAPRIRFLKPKVPAKKVTAEKKSNDNEDVIDESESADSSSEEEEEEEPRKKSTFGELTSLGEAIGNESLFTVKRTFDPKADNESDEETVKPFISKNKLKIKSKASVVKHLLKKNIQINEKVRFDKDGNRILVGINLPRSVNITDMLAAEMDESVKDSNTPGGIDIAEQMEFLRNEQEYDKKLYKDRIKRIHQEKRYKEKSIRRAKRNKTDINDNGDGDVTLGGNDDDSYDDDGED